MVGLILIAPVIVGFVVVVFFLGRQVDSRAQVRTAAESAAQAAARQRNPADAEAAALNTATAELRDVSTCAGGPTVTVDLANFRAGGVVTVAVACTTDTSDLAAIAAPARTLRATSSAVIDIYRAVTP